MADFGTRCAHTWRGFEVAVAKDVTAAPKHPKWCYGYTAVLINFAFLAHAFWTTARSRQGDGKRFIKLGQTHGRYKEMGQCLTQKNTKFWF
ncbi:MAG TPA: hypothetical protein VGY99_00170 [Candidatus Binataceae bacterium]|nr:hypothetical protein [Candidatus Binataceae bacterium]